MRSRFYFKFLLFIFLSFLIVFALSWLGFQKTQVKHKKDFLKLRLKTEASHQISFLNNHLAFLNHSIDNILEQVKEKNLSIEFPDQFAPSIEKFFIFDKQDLSLPLFSKTSEEAELYKILNLKNTPPQQASHKETDSQAYFEKIKWKGKSYFVLFQNKPSYVVITFLKRSYFNLSQNKSNLNYPVQKQNSKNLLNTQEENKHQNHKKGKSELHTQLKTRSKKTQSKALFASFNKNQDRFFYNSSLRDSPRFIESFFKNPSPKYITRKSKKNQTLYYLQEWRGTNLLLIVKKEKPLNFFTIFIEEDDNFLLIFSIAFLFLILLIFALYVNLSMIFQAYSFLKASLICYIETGVFPPDDSKSFLLSFYRNRQEILNDTIKEDSKTQDEAQLQELIQEEIKKIKSKYPSLILNKDFQTDIKLFGFQNFFRTILNELLLNAIESMGAMKEQKVDLCVKEENQNLVLYVRDYGIGLKESEKAFQIYYSTKSQLGVGLNLVQSIVTANQGQVELIPEKEGGLTAVVRLPLSCFLKK